MLASNTRAAIRIASVLYLALGVILFAAPAFAASVFPWSVSPLVAMTIGGWALGNGICAWLASARGPANRVLPLLGYLIVFAGGQLLVVIAFRIGFQLDALLAVPYLLTLLVTLISAAFGALELRATPAIVVDDAAEISRTVRLALIGLVAFLVVLTAGGFIAGTGGVSTTGKIFPEPLTLFTVRAFAAFYAALALGVALLVRRPTVASALLVGLFGVSLIVPVLIAALIHIGAFDFARRPLGLLYLGAYLVVLVPAVAFIWIHRGEMPTA